MKKKSIKKPIVSHLADHEKALNIIVKRLGLGEDVKGLLVADNQKTINILIVVYILLDVLSKFSF